MFLLCLARPELLEVRGIWAGSKRNSVSLVLEPLGPDDTEKLIADRLAGRTLPPETVARVGEISQGKQLFVEQLLAALKEKGRFAIPASVQILLAARLDRLGPGERDLMRTASVIGVDFSLKALVALLPEAARPFAGRHLHSLERKQLVRPSQLATIGEEMFSFCHLLIELAAYRSMARETRAELHERFAGWFEGEAAQSTPGFEEVVGYHLEQTYRERRQLGLLNAHSRVLAERAGEWLASAGLQAFGRFDVAAAENLWSRAKSLLPPDHTDLPQVRRYLVEAYEVLGRHAHADAMLREMLDELSADEDRSLEQVIGLERARIRLFTGPDPVSLRTLQVEAERALEPCYYLEGHELVAG